MSQGEVIIVGAGIAGLTAAYELAREGRAVVLLEARDRIGGRIHTISSGVETLPIELGAEFVHGEKVATWPFLRSAGLKAQEVPDQHWHWADGHFNQDNSFEEDLGKVTELVDLAGPDLSFQDFLDHARELTSYRRWLLREYVEGFHAADPKRMSAQAFVRSQQAAEDEEGTEQFWVAEGYGALLRWLKAELEGRGVLIHLRCCAHRLRWKPGEVEVQTDGPDGQRTFRGRSAVLTVPLSLLKAPGPAGLQFDPAPPGIAEALEGLDMGLVTKVVLQFRARFWPAKDFGFIHSTDPWLPTWWADPRGLVLTGWAGGPRVEQLRHWKEEALRAYALEVLARLFGLSKAVVSDALERMSTHNWSEDPFSRGAYSYVRVGASDAPKQLAEPVADTLFFAGEATADHDQQGTVHGAIQSAQRAARRILQVGA